MTRRYAGWPFRIRFAWRALRDACAEAFRWNDYGAAQTDLSNAWSALRGQLDNLYDNNREKGNASNG